MNQTLKPAPDLAALTTGYLKALLNGEPAAAKTAAASPARAPPATLALAVGGAGAAAAPPALPAQGSLALEDGALAVEDGEAPLVEEGDDAWVYEHTKPHGQTCMLQFAHPVVSALRGLVSPAFVCHVCHRVRITFAAVRLEPSVRLHIFVATMGSARNLQASLAEISLRPASSLSSRVCLRPAKVRRLTEISDSNPAPATQIYQTRSSSP